MNSFTGAQALRSMFLFVALAIVPLPGALQAAEEKWQLAMNNAELRDIV